MNGVDSSGKELMLREARKIKQKSNKKCKARPHEGDDVCAICDDGGYITCCDGGCLRSFHLTKEHGEASNCRTLGLTTKEAKVIIEKESFICKNCKYKQHQCFACELLGSSASSGAKVFQCKDANCGHFYHPKCVAELLHPDSKIRATVFEQHVAAGLKLLCPVHNCHACNGGENKDDVNLQFAVCRRCPATYHRKCLPSDIPFRTENGPNGFIQRAWDGILRDRILMYCRKHVEIVPELGIPMTRPIIFPAARDICIAEGPDCVPNEEDVLDRVNLIDKPLPLTTLPHSPSASIYDRFFCSNPDSFVPKSLCMQPYPGSCGWLDDSD